MRKFFRFFLFTLGALPLAIWPAAAVASAIGLGGHVPPDTPWNEIVLPYAFYASTLFYPVVYLSFFILYFLPWKPKLHDITKSGFERHERILLLYSIAPLLFLLFIVLLGYSFFSTGD